jgi:aminopeptidase N
MWLLHIIYRSLRRLAMSARILIVIVWLIFGVGVVSAVGAPSVQRPFPVKQFPDPAQYEVGSRQWLKAVEALKYRPLVDQRLIDNCPHSFDVLHYDITLFIDFTTEEIFGNTKVLSVSQVPDLSSIDLDLAVLTVDSVFSGTDTLSFTHVDSVLTIDLGQTYSAGDSFEVRVVYHGQPGNEGPTGFGGFYFDGTPTMAFQMGVGLVADPPSMGKFWFPCWDWPCDKATADYHITVPGTGKKIVCNGVLVEASVDTVNSTTTYVWSETHQIAPHVMTVHARRYTEIVDSTYDWIHYWVFAGDAEDALIHFQNVDIMMDGFVERYGPYPFSKFGYVAATKGDMEHQTCVTHVAQLINPNHLYDWLLAHELGHQWWGDCVSVNVWQDTWLSEGFATYSEAIFREYAYGTDSYHDCVESTMMGPVFASGENFPVADPDYLWGTTVYEKGACVLHMLRHVVGDSLFFDALAAYRAAHEYESATSAQFQQDVEGVYGQSLDWFFNEWLYDVGWPEYEFTWYAQVQGEQYDLDIIIDQVQTNGGIYTMPVDARITTVAGDTLVTLWVDEAHEEFNLTVSAQPARVELDPDNWILDKSYDLMAAIDSSDLPLDLCLEQNVPNPFGPSTTIRYSLPRADDVRIDIFNATGRKVKTLVNDIVPPGWREVVWDGTDDHGCDVASGTYFCRMTTSRGCRTRSIVLIR